MKKILFSLAAVVLCSCARNGDGINQSEILARVGDRTVTRAEIESLIPDGMPPADSLLRAESILKNRLTDILMDETAYRNLEGDKAEIEQLVSEYRRSLIRHRFQEQLVKDKVSSEISDADKMAYYEENKQQFMLKDNIIRGMFMITHVNAPNLNDVRKWYLLHTEEAMEKIEKYSLQNAVALDFFYDRWVNFEEIMARLPQQLTNPALFLKNNKHLETSDSAYVYFLNITDYRTVGAQAPYDYVTEQIYNMLANKRKIDYLQQFKDELYRDAVRKRQVQFLKE